MRLLILLTLIGIALPSGLCAEASNESKNAAYRKLRDAERGTHLLEQIGDAMEAHQYEKALGLADTAVALLPENTDALNAKGATLVELERYDEASGYFKQVLDLDPTNFPAAFNEMEINFLRGHYNQAAAQLRLLAEKFGASPLVKYKLYLCELLADDGGAEDVLEEIRFPADGPAWYFAHAARALKAGDQREARQLIAAAARIHSEDVALFRDSLEDTHLLQ